MKKALSLLLCLLMMFSAFPLTAFAAEEAPISIDTVEKLKGIKDNLSGNYRLTTDITLSEAWTPLGGSTAFSGTFDGAGHTIKGLTVSVNAASGTAYAGLFGNVSGTVQNLKVTGMSISVTGTATTVYAGLCGYLTGSVHGVSVAGTVTAQTAATAVATVAAGGIAGSVSVFGDISGCASTAKVTATDVSATSAGILGRQTGVYAGGIVGNSASWTTLAECSHKTGAVEVSVGASAKENATGYAGGIAGKLSGKVQDCYNTAAVTTTVGTATGYAGGIAGYGTSFATSYNTGKISTNDVATHCGAIAGYASGKSESCYYLKDSALSGYGSCPDDANPVPSAIALSSSGMWNKKCTGFDFDNVWDAQTIAAPVLYEKSEIISGKVTVSGTYEYGATLTADVSAITPVTAWNKSNLLKISYVTYQWYRGVKDSEGEIAYTAIDKATKETYTIAAADVGNYLYVTVRGRYTYGGAVSTTGTLVKKMTPATPGKPTVTSVTDTSVTLSPVNGAQYRKATYNEGFLGIGAGWKDQGDWQISNVFTGLTPETKYAFKVFIPESATTTASAESEYTEVTTMEEGYDPTAVRGTLAVTGADADGNAASGKVLTAVTTGLSASQTGTIYYNYQWNRNGVAITGATSASYTTMATDIGTDVTLSVTARSPFKGSFTSEAVHILPPQPMNLAAQNAASGVQLTWKAVAGIENYRVYRKTEGALLSSWTNIAEPEAAAYIDTSAVSGKAYLYAVCAVRNNTEGARDEIDNAIMYLSAPVLGTAENTGTAIRVSWKAVTGAESYTVYRKTGTGAFTAVASGLTEVTYTDTAVASGTAYTYSVKAVSGTSSGAYDQAGLQMVFLNAPTDVTVTPAANGLTVKWTRVYGATSYRIYRRLASSGSFTELTNTSVLNATDTTVESGKTYEYRVAAIASGTVGPQNATAVSCTFVSAPVVRSAVNTADGITVTWDAAPGAASYRVIRKNAAGTRTTVAEGVTKTTVTDTLATAGERYTYAVVAVAAKGESAESAPGVSCTRLLAAQLSAATNITGGVNVSWKAAAGAASYTVKRRTAGSEWITLKTVTGTTYTDTSAVSGTTYEYTVISVAGSDSSVAAASQTILCLGAPAITAVEGGVPSATVTWSAVAGAESYNVYRASGAGAYVLRGNVSTLRFTDTGLVSDNVYYYTVEAVSGTTKSARSPRRTLATLETPVLSSVAPAQNGITVSWGAVTGAVSYDVYRRAAGSTAAAVCIKEGVSGTSFTDTLASPGTEYAYSVIASDRTGGMSAISAEKIGAFLTAVTLTDFGNTATGITLSWDGDPAEAQTYTVLRKASGEKSFTTLGTLSASETLTFTDTTAVSGTAYTYAVRADATLNGRIYGSYVGTGVSITALSEVKLTGISGNSTAATLKWAAVPGAKSYNVYRATGAGEAVLIRSGVTATSYKDSTLKMGETYTYTVAAVSGSSLGVQSTKALTWTVIPVPVLVKLAATGSGLKLTFSGSASAKTYRIYRKAGTSKKWAKIATVSGTAPYLDKAVASGTAYCYTVIAVNGTSASSYNTAGLSAVFLNSPKLKSASTTSKGIQVSWGAVKGAQRYYIYRKTASTGWKCLTYVSASKTVYVDTKAKAGVKYTYTVRAKNGSSPSSFYPGIDGMFLAIPPLKSAKKVSGGITVSWGAVSGATGYLVYRKTGKGGWTRIATVGKTTAYRDKTCKKGVTYTYTVRAKNGKFAGGYVSKGVSCKY